MKRCLFLLALVSLAACREAPGTFHGDGSMSVPVNVTVTDAQSGRPLAGVSITFFNEEENLMLRALAARQEAGEKNSPLPSGVSAATDARGSATLTCRFSAYFSYRAGSSDVVRSQWWPSGRLELGRPGFAPMAVSLRDVLASPAPFKGEPPLGRVHVSLRPSSPAER